MNNVSSIPKSTTNVFFPRTNNQFKVFSVEYICIHMSNDKQTCLAPKCDFDDIDSMLYITFPKWKNCLSQMLKVELDEIQKKLF